LVPEKCSIRPGGGESTPQVVDWLAGVEEE